MINDINLIPDKYLFFKKKILNFSIKIVISIVAISSFYTLNSYLISERNKILLELNKQNAIIQSQSLKEINEYDEKLAVLKTKEEEVANTYSFLTENTPNISKIYNAIVNILPVSSSLVSLNYSENSNAISLVIKAKNIPEISGSLKSLNKNENIKSLKISKINSSKGESGTSLYELTVN